VASLFSPHRIWATLAVSYSGPEEALLPAIRSALPAAALLVMLAQGCASTAQEPQPAPPQSAAAEEPLPELNLNLPDDDDDCVCPADDPEPPEDLTYLEKGFSAIVAGEYIEAVQYFERYKRAEDTVESDWEAGVAIAYVSMLAESPFHDPETARKSYRKLRKKYGEDMLVHEKTLLMRDSLETFIGMDRKLDKLQEQNAKLKQELEKRDEAIRRLRELTLGQKGAAP
jgi:hypothetical protein